jgi:hypothetical protein
MTTTKNKKKEAIDESEEWKELRRRKRKLGNVGGSERVEEEK